jgi:hypothetical protein
MRHHDRAMAPLWQVRSFARAHVRATPRTLCCKNVMHDLGTVSCKLSHDHVTEI